LERNVESGFSYSRLGGKILAGILLFTLLFGSSPAVFGKHPVVRLMVWTHQRHMANLTKSLIQEFNATVGKRKEMVVSLRILGDDASGLFQKAQMNMEGPDLYSTNFNTGVPEPFRDGARIYFDDLPGFKAWKARFPQWYWIEGVTTYHGHVFAIPTEVINSRLIYNRDLFRAIGRDPNRPPKSYRELREIARAITIHQRGAAFGFAYCGAEDWPLEWMPSQWAEANGEPAYWDWSRGRWAINGYRRVFQLLLDLQKEGSLFPGADMLTNEALRAQFAEGRVAMFMGESWDVGVLNEQFRTKCDWGVAPIPTYDGKYHGKPRAMVTGGYFCINAQTRYKRQAWEVVKWFSRYEVRARMVENGKCIDPDPVVAKRYVKKPYLVRGFKEFAGTLDDDYLATYPYLPGWREPNVTPFNILRGALKLGWDLDTRLNVLDQAWNFELDKYYRDNPGVKREWNIYPAFDRTTGKRGKPLVEPDFK
jgi:multiple sugar transport system substrate-binding protein